MNIRLLAGGVAIAVAGVIGYGIYQMVPMGKPLKRSEVIGELNGPPLALYSRVTLQRYGERQLLIGQRLVSSKDIAELEKAPVLDRQVPVLEERLQKQRSRLAEAGAATALASGNTDLALLMLQDGRSTTDTRNLIYGGQGTGAFDLLGSISGDKGVGLIGTPEGRTLYLVTSTIRSSGDGEQPTAWDTLRSDDLGKTWTYDADVTLGFPQQHTVFLTQDRAIALERHEAGHRLLVSSDGARSWSATLLDDQVWPDAQSYDRAFYEKTAKAGGASGEDQLAYDWSLYPLDEKRAVGWSWRTRISLTASQKNEVLETRRFEVEFQDGASPAFRITPAQPPAPPQSADVQVTRDQPVFETSGSAVYELDKAERTWHRRSDAPAVRGNPSWIGDAWFGRKAWVIKTYADHLLSFNEYTKTYFYTRDQGKTWQPFQIPQDVETGLLGLDQSGDALLSLGERDGKTVIRRYPLD
ncbi:hypothetical protein RAS12_08570 [Achromobacter seleniivolatilans]|uniref:Sialidase domain-containing protein n=1 Tax=Achromobacter seleniivolatilans TaxID=3047478 RepID=A0ABY9M5X3_9BURK|nr:hypothetical protein [Achromobacter sp. R39]WMD22416.1 hypothetical protein RAS12_08570 [Achromobacter sp. R39]